MTDVRVGLVRPSVLLQPCGLPAQVHFGDTVRSTVPKARILRHVPPGQRVALESMLSSITGVATWGVEPGRGKSGQRAWQLLKHGDLVVFGGLRRVLASGFVVGKIECEQLADELWGSDTGERWPNIYFLQQVELYDNLPFAEFNRAARYKPTARPQNLRLIRGQRAGRIIDWLRRT
jgi:hypothetical protein